MSRKEHLVWKEISEWDIASVLTATQTVHALRGKTHYMYMYMYIVYISTFLMSNIMKLPVSIILTM